ncbi:hypothetical protein CEP52_011680 [Fusarium oligoseptatum]|uniref:Heterokaryon incompatibility domain-containing protein n=1 Tax=Fusarium oligoseptatum TaxID=2604345 RepID=A0A428T247_9HYPO|nr:hypothetical protein CEP52_011680 [Fusarium oligoseptatum]
MAQDTDARPENPLLCDSCQIWDNVDSYAEWWPYPESFDPLQNAPESVQCMVCKAAMTAITTRVSQMSIPQNSQVLFRNNGPYFLDHDTGDPAESISHRIDISDPFESVVRLLMGLVVKVESETSTVTDTAQSEKSEFEMAPHGGRDKLEKGNRETLEKPGGLAKIALPPIITDTMLLCKQLGENYLWIDRFCIIQDDPNSKHGQIRGMDRIYRCANFTIMAALSGQEAWGLPGLVGRPRVSSAYKLAPKFDVELREIKPKGLSAAETSIWNTRGWTFQERVLSTRRLYITEHEALFECCLGCASEDLAHYPPHQRTNRGNAPEDEFRELPGFFRWPEYGRGVNYHITDNTSLKDYLDWVANYTSRQLSFGSDVLNAFSGTGNLLGQVLGSNLIFCLPEKFLVQALMWTASDNIVMRTGIPENLPSWSWASSPSKVDYKWIMEDKEDCLRVISLVYFCFQDAKEGLRKVETQEWWIEGEMAIEEFRNRDDVPPIEKHQRKVPPRRREK